MCARRARGRRWGRRAGIERTLSPPSVCFGAGASIACVTAASSTSAHRALAISGRPISWEVAARGSAPRGRGAQKRHVEMRVAGFRHVALNFDFLRSPKRRGEHRGADWGRARAQWPRKAAMLLDSGRVVLLI